MYPRGAVGHWRQTTKAVRRNAIDGDADGSGGGPKQQKNMRLTEGTAVLLTLRNKSGRRKASQRDLMQLGRGRRYLRSKIGPPVQAARETGTRETGTHLNRRRETTNI